MTEFQARIYAWDCFRAKVSFAFNAFSSAFDRLPATGGWFIRDQSGSCKVAGHPYTGNAIVLPDVM